MMKLLTRQAVRLLLVLILGLGLGSCGGLQTHPPEAAVIQAIGQKLEQTQSLLSRQLAFSLGNPTIDQVIINQYQWTVLQPVADPAGETPHQPQPVVRVQGTYQLKGGGLNRRQQRRRRSFELYLAPRALQPGKGWVTIEPAPRAELSR
ncbi:MAG: hypothetical protein KGQ93_11365 [Cyanobacteria bacterium REEB459]|nr:hypothetical protein [Cyanobacteria bacterium REEB459]